MGELRYKPYGETRYIWGVTRTDRRFTGQREEAGLGLYDYRARFYDPLLGRFISADTVVPNPLSPQLFNRYSYAGNSPVLYNDPDGHCGPLCILGVAAALVAVLMLTSDVPPPPDSPVAYSRSGNQRVGEVAFGVAGSYGVTSLVVPGVTVPVTAQTVAGTAAAGACADGNCTNEVEATASFVRKFTSGDMDALRNFSRRALQIQSQRGMKSFGEQWEMLGEIAAQQPEAANNLFTFQRDGIVEGAMRVREISGQFWITHLEGFGGGAGTELVKAAIQESIARGYEGTIHLIPAPQAISFYENLGFTLVRIGPGGAEYVLTAEVAKKLLGQ